MFNVCVFNYRNKKQADKENTNDSDEESRDSTMIEKVREFTWQLAHMLKLPNMIYDTYI